VKYGVGNMSPSDRHKVDVAWNNCFRKIWKVVPNHYCFTASLLADQREKIFYEQTMCSGNIVHYVYGWHKKRGQWAILSIIANILKTRGIGELLQNYMLN